MWKQLVKMIPDRVQLKARSVYEVLWVDDFADGKTLGEMRPDTKQIIIKKGQTAKDTVTTYLHEILHSISEETGAKLTETQILKLEPAFYYILKKGNILKNDKT